MSGRIVKVSGPLIVAEGMGDVQMHDMVRVSDKNLTGEVIELRGDKASIQVYEETAGLGPGEVVESTGSPMSVELAPGLIESIFDGIQRPLDKIREQAGDRITRGLQVDKLSRSRKWKMTPVAHIGQQVVGGDIIGTVQETPAVLHKIMVPPGKSGTLTWVTSTEVTIVEPCYKLKDADGKEVTYPMLQLWPVRVARPYVEKLPPEEPMVTGQRVIDALFPIAKGGVAAVPGPFGSGKTVIQHQLAKWADADIIVYVGCGERGNEMTDVLMEFPELKDPRTGLPLMKRTVLIANTSDMPVAAREASIYTGITIAEYFRDMGYKVAIMADSTSRWAEALREMSSRLEEMPGEEGYPAYLASRIAEFYERAGIVRCIGSDKDREGAVSAIGAVSPPGGDISEPVSQATLRIVKVFWCLSAQLAYARHFPAIDWLQSYSLYSDRLRKYFNSAVAPDWSALVEKTMSILQQEAELNEIVQLVGMDALAFKDRITMGKNKKNWSRSIREDFLHQNSFHEIDTYTSLEKQYAMLKLIITWNDKAQEALLQHVHLDKLIAMKVREQIGRMRYIPEKERADKFAAISKELDSEFAALTEGGAA
jgi:V/A-type H+-transporting ATPase subunit A